MTAPERTTDRGGGRGANPPTGAGAERLARWLDLLRRDPTAPDALRVRLAALLHDPALARRVAEGLRRRAEAPGPEAAPGAAAARPATGLAARMRGFLGGSEGGLAMPDGLPLLGVPPSPPGRAAAALHRARLRGSAALGACGALAAVLAG